MRVESLVKRRGTGPESFTLVVRRLEIRRGDQLCLMAASGAGKTTMLDILGLALRPTAAEVFELAVDADPCDVWREWQRDGYAHLARLRSRHVGYVLQEGGLLPFLTARENIELPLRLCGRQDDARVSALAERLGLASCLRRRPSDLSAGERQRVVIARAVVHGPDLILADEPTAALDEANAVVTLDLLIELAHEARAALVVSSHARHHLERVGLDWVRHESRVEAAGRVSEFWTS